MKKNIKGILTLGVALGALTACGGSNPNKVMNNFDKEFNRSSYTVEFKQNYTVKCYESGELSTNPTVTPFLRDLENTRTIKIDKATGYAEISESLYNKEDVWTSAKERVVAYYKDAGNRKMITSDDREITGLDAFPDGYNDLATYTKENTGSFDEAALLFNPGENNKGQEYMVKYFTLKEPTEATPFGAVNYSVNEAGGVDIVYNAGFVGYKTDGGLSSAKAITGHDYAAVIEISTDAQGYVTHMKETFSGTFALPLWKPNPVIEVIGTREMNVSYDAITPLTSETIPQIAANSQVYLAETENGSYTVYSYNGDYPIPGVNTTEVSSLDVLPKGTKIAIAFTPDEDFELASFKVNNIDCSNEVSPMGWMGVVGHENVKFEVSFMASIKDDPEVDPNILYSYTGSLATDTEPMAVGLILYKDGTFIVDADFGGPERTVCYSGTYTEIGVDGTTTLTCTDHHAFAPYSQDTTVLTMDFTNYSLTTAAFFHGNGAEFTLPTNDNEEEGGETSNVKFAYTGELATDLDPMAVGFILYKDNTFIIDADFNGPERTVCYSGTYTDIGADGTTTLTCTEHHAFAPYSNDTAVLTMDFATYALSTDSFFHGKAASFTLVNN